MNMKEFLALEKQLKPILHKLEAGKTTDEVERRKKKWQENERKNRHMKDINNTIDYQQRSAKLYAAARDMYSIDEFDAAVRYQRKAASFHVWMQRSLTRIISAE
jgi:hypothetical protein